jgi:multisubunit Na+/H+ antiporter MnhE subunit
MISAGDFAILHFIFGVIIASVGAFLALRHNIIKKDIEPLFFHFGFYRHFAQLFIKNFISSVFLLFKLAFSHNKPRPLLYRVNFDATNKFQPSLLVNSFSMSSGLLSLGMIDDKILVHAINENYFNKFNLKKIITSLKKASDDNLV